MVTPSPDAVRLELDRVLTSSTFTSSKRLSRFLRFVVERALAGDTERLKEYVIGVEVFDRDAAYDPRVDSIVRVEAGRLRAKLREYYESAGAENPVVIGMQRGSYAPTLLGRPLPVPTQPLAPARPGNARRTAWWSLGVAAVALVVLFSAPGVWHAERTSTPLAQPGARLAVLPFSTYSTAPADLTLAARLTDGVTAELVRLGQLNIVSSASARAHGSQDRSSRDVSRELGAELLLRARVTTDAEHIDVEALLVDGASDRKIWVSGFAGTVAEPNELEQRIAAAIARAIHEGE